MRYLSVDLQSICWSKLDYSMVCDMSKIVLLNNPILLDNFYDWAEFGSKHNYFITVKINDIDAVIMYANQNYCSDNDIFELYKLLNRNISIISCIFNSEVVDNIFDNSVFDESIL